MKHFPDFMKNPKNKIDPLQQNTPDIEGYYYEAADGSQMAFMIVIQILIFITYLILPNILTAQTPKADLYLKLADEFELKAKPAYPDEDIFTFNHFEIFQNGKILFKDTTLTEYTIQDSLYPKLYNFKNHIELLIETDERPNKNLVYGFCIKEGEIDKIDTFPTFLTRPKDLDYDNKLEYAGFWDHGEVWENSIVMTNYNPIVFYEITENGIILDSLTTIAVNTHIYGKFYGFYFNEQIEFPYEENSLFLKEIERILYRNF